MANINFASKGLNQKIFSKKAVLATTGKKSSAFRTLKENPIFARVVDRKDERKVFYNALREEGLTSGGRGITRKVMKKVLGRIEHSGKFSHAEMHELGKELIGGDSNIRIIYQKEQGKPTLANGKNLAVGIGSQPSHMINISQLKTDILAKGETRRTQLEEINNSSSLQHLEFSQSNKKIRKAEDVKLVKKVAIQNPQNKAENFGVVPKYLERISADHNEEIRSKLANLQDEEAAQNDNEEESSAPQKLAA